MSQNYSLIAEENGVTIPTILAGIGMLGYIPADVTNVGGGGGCREGMHFTVRRMSLPVSLTTLSSYFH